MVSDMAHEFVAQDFAGRTAVVTGAGSGIGRATALALVARGAHVVAVDWVAARLEALVVVGSAAITPVTCDLSDAESISTIMASTNGTIDCLVNNAGVMDGFLPPAEIDDATWESVFAINLTAAMRLTRAVLPGMISMRRGAIVNVSSEASLRGSVSGVAYCASKHALNGVTKSVAFFYRSHGIRANAVLPGGVQTNIEAPFLSPYAREQLVPVLTATMPPIAQPEQVASCIAWLLSDSASNVNGALVPCDGGWSVL
ncbi:MAG: SDR family NAD(P)-dependent oxidoreductase [Acidimicrobiia bacterium]